MKIYIMTDELTTSDFEQPKEEKAKLPSGLNVLTILTFIGCGIGILLTVLTPAINNFFLGMMEKAQSSGAELNAKQLEDMEKGKAVIKLSQANMVPLMAVGLISIALCLVGAIMMRKLKKDGYWLYVGGELLPVIGGLIIMGTAQFTGAFSIVIGVGLPILFVLLYSLQRKYLVK